MFRLVRGTHNFFVIGSVVDIMIKNNLPVLENMGLLTNLQFDSDSE